MAWDSDIVNLKVAQYLVFYVIYFAILPLVLLLIERTGLLQGTASALYAASRANGAHTCIGPKGNVAADSAAGNFKSILILELANYNIDSIRGDQEGDFAVSNSAFERERARRALDEGLEYGVRVGDSASFAATVNPLQEALADIERQRRQVQRMCMRSTPTSNPNPTGAAGGGHVWCEQQSQSLRGGKPAAGGASALRRGLQTGAGQRAEHGQRLTGGHGGGGLITRTDSGLRGAEG